MKKKKRKIKTFTIIYLITGILWFVCYFKNDYQLLFLILGIIWLVIGILHLIKDLDNAKINNE